MGKDKSKVLKTEKVVSSKLPRGKPSNQGSNSKSATGVEIKENGSVKGKKKSPCNDIDSMFSNLAETNSKQKIKLAKLEAEQKRLEKARRKEAKLSKDNQPLQPKSHIISPYAPLHRVDAATGLPVYKAAALLVGEGGGTSLCPFDCDCCF